MWWEHRGGAAKYPRLGMGSVVRREYLEEVLPELGLRATGIYMDVGDGWQQASRRAHGCIPCIHVDPAVQDSHDCDNNNTNNW